MYLRVWSRRLRHFRERICHCTYEEQSDTVEGNHTPMTGTYGSSRRNSHGPAPQRSYSSKEDRVLVRHSNSFVFG
ncbi:hypothetical protein DPMN_016972 [Dreissena polymorpha]|uniref:Uncharacterized protein n=1 Tax=Dreissena polymorpha TaxID=45954 RepID=A0A9D4NFK4_DREPO|nr:hypothetical protein DPMN_016972 [Dreissena polymorpha]